LDPNAIPILKSRHSNRFPGDTAELSGQLFTLMFLGDDRVVDKTYVAGSVLYSK
jgi:hypothetical protein